MTEGAVRPDRDLPLGRELDRVVEQILKDAGYLGMVAVNVDSLWRAMDGNLDSLLLQRLLIARDGLSDHYADIEFLLGPGEIAAGERGQIEGVIDHLKKLLGVFINLLQHPQLFIRQLSDQLVRSSVTNPTTTLSGVLSSWDT